VALVDDLELLPGPRETPVGDQRLRAARFGGDEGTRERGARDLAATGEQADHAGRYRVVELLPQADRGRSGDQRLRPARFRRHELAVGEGLEGEGVAALGYELELLPQAGRDRSGDQRCGATGLRRDELAVRPGLEGDDVTALADL